MRLSARPSLVAVSCCQLVPSSYLLAFRLTDTVCRVACPLLPGFPPPLLSSILHPVRITGFSSGSFGFSASFLRGVAPFRVESVSVLDRDEGSSSPFLVFGWSLRDEVTLTGRVCLRSRSERRLCAPYLGVGAKPSRWGHPSRVVWRLSAHSFGTKASSIHLSLVASRWGHPMGRVWFFSHSIATKSSLVIWSVFLQDGVTLFWSGSIDLISSEGIPPVGLLGAFFQPVLGVSFCLPLVGRSALKRGGFHFQLSSLLARTLCVSL